MRRTTTFVAMLLGASSISMASAAFAQEATTPGTAAGEPPAVSSAMPGGAPSDEVIVTGSRVVTGNTSPTPLTTVSTANLLQNTPTTVADALYKLPVFAGLPAQTRNPGNSSGNSGANNLNLRSIGAARTLVLFNGQRVPDNNVDQLPQMLMQRVDIVTGGASAVYGSDAVAGVVNFIIDKHFDGLKANGSIGVSTYGDDVTYRLGIAGGTTIGRLHIEGSVEHYDDPGIFSKLSRPWGRDVWSTQGAGTTANPYREVKNTRISNTSFGGKIVSGPLANQNFSTNGVLTPFINGTATGASTIQSGGDGAFFNTASLKTKLKNTQYFGRADYELTDDINVWAQGSYVDTNNKNNHQTNEFRNYTVSATNAFLRPEYQAAMAAAGVKTFTIGKMMEQAPPLQPETFLKTYIISGGFDGKVSMFGSDWSWDVQGMTSRQKQHTFNNANMDGAKAAAALDAVVDPATGNIVCHVTLTNPSAYPGCVPINIFGPTSESQQAIDYILLKTDFTTITTLKEVNASISGSPFSTWAGPVKFALSGEMREATVKTNSNFQPTDRVDCSTLPLSPAANAKTPMNCSIGSDGKSTQARWVSNVVARLPKASVSVKEVAVETDIPLLKDVPFVQSFNINAAARYTDYETSGTVWTWKIGADWHVNDDLRLRATRSRDILAPSVTQLFGAASVNPSGITDLHTGINAVAPVQTNSNPNLVPEVANTLTGGVVYRPSWLPSFSISVDYYRIKIGNAIANVSGNDSTVMRICEDSNGTSPLCSLYVRPLPFSDRSPANYPTLILANPLNIAKFLSEGVDTEVNYGFDVGSGRVNLRGLMTYTAKQRSQTLPGTVVLDAAGAAGLPSIRAVLQAQYVQGPFRFDLLERWHNSTRRSSNPNDVWAEGRVASRGYTDMTIAYDIKMLGGTSQLYLNIQNLFNTAPAVHGATGGSSSVPGLFLATTNGDDIIGRYFTMGFRYKF
ncbi:TonB-dependent receptor domain-containing protein [Sphingomonas quercus]|uniref:TonB-dependent receptor n=1 Tax=Sphingomonas quercus TaxID=2842451 RepID=A0ABS6BL67_9SPHN|nr:TonB-dependent receptor [Sphingomonas quercus]MBU3079049.1 TonB-dependent receptor [Sphingomonas quercus]